MVLFCFEMMIDVCSVSCLVFLLLREGKKEEKKKEEKRV
jgi:hypothetical protein